MDLRTSSLGIGALAVAMLAGPARSDDRSQVRLAEDLVYTKAGDRELRLDLAAPAAGRGPFPAVVVIHGGAWRGGDKKDQYVREFLLRFPRRGYVAISPQYRLCPRETFPAQVHDVKAAVRWLRAHAEEHRVDPDRIGAMGFSAGGHLALMLGLTGPDDGLEGDAPADAPSSRVRAVVNFFGPTELAADGYPDVSKGFVRDFLGGTPAEKPEACRRASPVSFATRDDGPVLTFHGTRDPLVPQSQAVKLADALTAAGVPGRVELLLGAGHGWGGDLQGLTTDRTFAFFDAHLKPGTHSR